MKSIAYDLFDNVYPPAPPTEGIKYAGSKKRLIPQILWLANKVRPHRILDGFSGSTRVSQAFARTGFEVVANDTAVFSEVFANCYLRSRQPERYQKLIEHLNKSKPIKGWFTRHYGGSARDNSLDAAFVKMPWQTHNTMKLDGIREEIDRLSLDEDERSVAITSLILALDRVDSTLGHYASYLREWSGRSFANLELRLPRFVESDKNHRVLRGDAIELAEQADVDLAYFDPPYGSNNEKMPPSRVRYSAYYHLWTTICLNDKPELFGKANRRVDTKDTASRCPFEEFRRDSEGRFIAVSAVERLIQRTAARHIILSYSSGGRATAKELHEVISESGEVIEVLEVDHRKNVMAGMSWTNEWLRDADEPHKEFLFLVRK